jgi:thioredoxin-related protein
MKPIWDEIEKENSWLKSEYYDIDEKQDLFEKYHVEDYPCFIFLDKTNNEIERIYGEVPKRRILKKIIELKNK